MKPLRGRTNLYLLTSACRQQNAFASQKVQPSRKEEGRKALFYLI